MPVKRKRWEILVWSLKALLVLALSLVCSLIILRLGGGNESVIMVFLLGVLLVPIFTRGYVYGLVAAMASVILLNFFFAEPRYTFMIYRAKDMLLLGFFFVTAIVSGTITSRLQKQMSISQRNALTARLLYEVAESFLHVTGKASIIHRGIDCIFDNTGITSRVVLCGDEQAYESACPAPPGAKERSIPIQGVTGELGKVVLYCAGEAISFQQELVVKTVAAQLGATLDRERSYMEREQIRLAMERERLRSILLRSVAHDLRTPLTALTGASSLLADGFEKLSAEEQKKLASDISEEMIWLGNLVENILKMTRISEDRLVLDKEDEVVDDVVNEAVSHMARILQNRRLEVSLPDRVISLPMDGKLIVQVIVNLLGNAVKHTSSDGCIGLKVHASGKDVIFEVADNGHGIDPAIMEKLFDGGGAQSNAVADGKRGIGLGLSICKAVVEAHGGKMHAKNKKSGGAFFVFSLPMGRDGEDV